MEQLMCYKFNVDKNYPKLKIFKNGKHTDFTGPYFVKSIVKYLKTKAGLFSKELNTIQEVKTFINNEESSIIGFFSSINSSLATEFHNQTEFLSYRYRFAYTSNPDLIAKYNFTDSIVMFQSPMLLNKIESPTITFEINKTMPAMRTIIEANYHGIVGYRLKENFHEFNGCFFKQVQMYFSLLFQF